MRHSMVAGSVFVLVWVAAPSFAHGQPPLAEREFQKKGAPAQHADSQDGGKAQDDASNASDKKVIRTGIEWLIASQQSDGGWGAGSHARQDIRDPAAVPSDPATTAFAAIGLLKAGHHPVKGEHRDALLAATRFLVKAVEAAGPNDEKITSLTGTQPQTKLGSLIDTAMTAQFLTRVSELLPPEKRLTKRVNAALDECLRRLEKTQQGDGSWSGGGGWAPILQSSLNCSSLELAKAIGRKVSDEKLEKARSYQKANINASTGAATSDKAAGVELYAFAGGLRGNAAEASQAQQAIDQAKQEGKLDESAETNEENLRVAVPDVARARQLGQAFQQNNAQVKRLGDEQLLAGFGNNGGEEFLSYLMTSESLVIAGGKAWTTWNKKMKERLGKIQNTDGSWSGHHCITSPVFCTAAAIQVLTTERDVKILRRVAAATE